eukprot:scaffold12317_cov115-Isochrysis_galbana.AAC.1
MARRRRGAPADERGRSGASQQLGLSRPDLRAGSGVLCRSGALIGCGGAGSAGAEARRRAGVGGTGGTGSGGGKCL